MQLLGVPFETRVFRFCRVLTGRLIKLLIFFWREPRPMLDLALPPVGSASMPVSATSRSIMKPKTRPTSIWTFMVRCSG